MRAPWLLVCVCAFGCEGSEQPPASAEPPRLLVVGWDGAGFRQVDRLLAEGRLPNVARLLERGSSAVLESTIVPVSSAAWPAAATGMGPGMTGVYDFFAPVPGTYDVQLVSARALRAPPIWRLLSARGLRSVVFGVPLTYPPEPILGVLVAGMLSPFDADYAWPPGLAQELRARGFVPDLDAWTERRELGWSELERQLALKEEILLELLTEEDWSLAFLVFKSLDVVAHLAYERDLFEQVAPVYERLDEILGRLLAAAGPSANVLLVSDHGFREYGSGFHILAWLLEQGFASLREDAWARAVAEGDPLAERERDEILRVHELFDWSRTRAFPFSAEGNFGGVRLNLAGREPAGTVTPAEAPRLLEALAEALGADPAVRRVWRADELYPGPHASALPDLLFEVEEGQQVFVDPDEPGVRGDYPVVVPDHEREGLLVAAGPDVLRKRERARAAMVDLAPTALRLLRQPIPRSMQGRALAELLGPLPRPDPIAAPALPPRAELERPFTPEELEELGERLRRLGYGG